MPASRIDPPVQQRRAWISWHASCYPQFLKIVIYHSWAASKVGYLMGETHPCICVTFAAADMFQAALGGSQWDESETHPCIVAFRGRWPVINSWQLKHPTSMLHLSSHSTNRRWSMVFHNHMFRFLSLGFLASDTLVENLSMRLSSTKNPFSRSFSSSSVFPHSRPLILLTRASQTIIPTHKSCQL